MVEERVFNKTFKEILTEYPEMEGSYEIHNIIIDLLPKFGFEISNDPVWVRNPVQAVHFGKGKYFNGKYQEKVGLFLCYIGVGFTGSTLTVVFNPQVV